LFVFWWLEESSVTFLGFAGYSQQVEDDALMRQVRDGDVGRLALLFDRHNRALFRFFVHLTGNHEVSEDLVQDVFFRILKYRSTYQADTNFRAWLYQIARNAHVDSVGKHKAEIAMPEEVEFKSPGKMPDEAFRNKQEAVLLRKALAAMPVEKREVLVMSRYQDLKYEEIAKILKCEVGTVKVRVYRALRELGDRFFALRGERAS
jgi:RNA polymerase sigma factor (sigma-70 family)